jgi:hypothetical protein
MVHIRRVESCESCEGGNQRAINGNTSISGLGSSARPTMLQS